MTMTARERRLGLHLPVQVAGVDTAGVAFGESTRSLNISARGIAFECRHHLAIGTRIGLQIALPPALRGHFGGHDVYSVRAAVCRLEEVDAQDIHRVGARFLGKSEP